MKIHLGYEVSTGKPVAIPLAHMAVTGMTQRSGKTTTLEALVTRSGLRAIAFVTKRGEKSFTGGHSLKPYFRDRADWQFVTSIIDATLQEKNKFLRPWIMKICRNTRTLADVQREVRAALQTAKGINEGVYTQLDAYLDLIVPEITRAPLAKSLDLATGLNVMDVSAYATPMQMLFVRSALDHVNEHESGVVTIIPEAWEFIPQGMSSPVKAAAVTLARKGAGIGNFIWVDSQDMAGVDKTILRGCSVWLIGVQREANEIERALANIPASVGKPTAKEIALLSKGQFFACWDAHVVRTYVQPAWMGEAEARAVATGTNDVADVKPPKNKPKPQKEDDDMAWKERAEAAEKRAEKLEQAVKDLQRQLDAAKEPFTPVHAPPPKPSSAKTTPTLADSNDVEEALYQAFKQRLTEEAPALLKVLTLRPEIEVEVKREVVNADGSSLRGRIALLIVKGFFETPQGARKVYAEVQRLGFTGANNTQRELESLAEKGFLTREAGEGFKAVPDMKKNIRQV
jgi:hypothetical protein